MAKWIGALQGAGQAARDAVGQRRLDGRPYHGRRRVHLAPSRDPGIGFDADQARVLRAVGGGVDIGQSENDGLDSGDLHGKVPRGGRRIVTDARVRRQARSSGCRVLQDRVELRVVAVVELRRSRLAHARRREDAPPHQHFLQQRRFQQHRQIDERQQTIEYVARARGVAALPGIPHLHVNVDGVRRGHEPRGAASKLREHPATVEAPKYAHRAFRERADHAADVVRARVHFLFDVVHGLDVAHQIREKRGVHSRLRVLHEQRQPGGLRDARVVGPQLVRPPR